MSYSVAGSATKQQQQPLFSINLVIHFPQGRVAPSRASTGSKIKGIPEQQLGNEEKLANELQNTSKVSSDSYPNPYG